MKKITNKKSADKISAADAEDAIARAPKIKLHTVLLNGEHALLRAFLRAWLSRFNHLHVVAEASNSR